MVYREVVLDRTRPSVTVELHPSCLLAPVKSRSVFRCSVLLMSSFIDLNRVGLRPRAPVCLKMGLAITRLVVIIITFVGACIAVPV